MDIPDGAMTPDVLLALRLRTGSEPLLPRLKKFYCGEPTEAFLPFLPLFLSLKTTKIFIAFDQDYSTIAVASTISRLSTLCPDLERISLIDLPRNSVITNAVSEMVLGCNPNSLRELHVESPLTEEAQEVVYHLPRLTSLWARFKGPTSLPTVALPDLTEISIGYKDDLSWVRGFRGAKLERLESVTIISESSPIGDPLGAFERVASTTSVKNTLSRFRFSAWKSWNPNYRALLSFRQLKSLEIKFLCSNGCSSTIDDDMITNLAQAMPKLEILQLGDYPCRIATGVTVNGLMELAHRCPHLSELRIHFQAASLVDAVAVAVARPPSGGEHAVQGSDCALTDLEVGEIPIPAGSGSSVSLVLLQIFPRLLNVRHVDRGWGGVAKNIKTFRQTGTFVHHSGKAHSPHLQLSLVICYQLETRSPQDTHQEIRSQARERHFLFKYLLPLGPHFSRMGDF